MPSLAYISEQIDCTTQNAGLRLKTWNVWSFGRKHEAIADANTSHHLDIFVVVKNGISLPWTLHYDDRR